MTETSLAPSHPGSVMLEVGGTVGALVVHVPPELCGAEIDTSPVTDPRRRTHSAVRERVLPAGPTHAVVFPALVAGEHTVWSPHGGAAGTVRITAGAVTEVDWSGLCRPAAGGTTGPTPTRHVAPPVHPRVPASAPDPKEGQPR
jgi:hypothetical protein